MKAVFFDMDGVLVDSEEQWKLAERPFFRTLIPSWRDGDHARVVGLGVEDLYRLLTAEYGLKDSKPAFLSYCQTIAEDVYLRRVTGNVEAVNLIDDLRKKKISIGLVSSSPHEWIKMVLKRFAWTEHFDFVVSADDTGGIGKPAPAIYLLASEKAGALPGDCLAIEDSAYGVASAKAAGLLCIAYRNGSNEDQDLSRADCEVRQFSELNAAKLRKLHAEKGAA